MPLVLALVFVAPSFAPAGAADPGAVRILASEDGMFRVASDAYDVELRWPPTGTLVPTSAPVNGTIATADGQRIEYAQQVHVLVNSAVKRYMDPVLDSATLPSAYLVRLDEASVGQPAADVVTLSLRFTFLGIPDAPANLSGITQYTFLPGRVQHGYGYRFASATAPSVRVNETFAFTRPVTDVLSITPIGQGIRDHGESLDRYSTWEAYTHYGMLFRDAPSSASAFDLHRVNSSGYTNYLDAGRMRGDANGAYFFTWFNAIDQFPQVFSRVGVEVDDMWNFPVATTTPRDLARFYAQVRGGSLGELPPRPPPLDTTPYPLRCPDFPLAPDGSRCTPVVVAVVDSGVNPYHRWFRRTGYTAHPSTYLEGFPAGARSLGLTFTIDHDYNTLVDLEALADVGRDELVTIPGTNIIGAISFGEYEAGDSVPILDEFGHGTGTAGAVVDANPDVLLVIVEMGFEDLERALDWIAKQEWIDMVTMSLGTLGDVGPIGRMADAASASPQNFTRAIAESGRMVFVPTGNNAGYGATDFYDGPNWVVSVGGVNRDTRGWWVEGTHGQDVSSDSRRALPRHNNDTRTIEMYGTSFASPTLAGSVSRAILEARAALGQTTVVQDGAYLVNGVTAREIREAINATAVWYAPQDYDAPNLGNLTSDDAKADDLPFPPVAPWTVSGWGYLGPAQAPALRDALLGAPLPEKPLEAQLFMEAQYALRAAIWTDTYPVWGPHAEQPIIDR